MECVGPDLLFPTGPFKPGSEEPGEKLLVGGVPPGYFIPGRDGIGAWQISGVIRAAACACFVFC